MANYKELFIAHMDAKGVKYMDKGENVVRVAYSGDNLQSIPVFVFFDKDGDPMVQFKCWEIANFNGAVDAGIRACNALNAKYRWVKFYLDKDNDVICECDAYIDVGTCGSECLSLVQRVVNIADDAYPDLMRARYA